MNLGENIKEQHEKRRAFHSQELAERLQVHQKDISRWENDERTPTDNRQCLRKYAESLTPLLMKF